MTRLGRSGFDLSFSDALRAAVAERGLSLARLSSRLAERGLHVGVSTLSTWQSGQRVPRDTSADVLAALEELLDVPGGWLRDRVRPARVEAARPRRPFRVADNAGALGRLVAALDTDAHGALRTLGVVEELVLGDDGTLERKAVVQSVRAVRPADRVLVVHRAEHPGDIRVTEPVAVSGCRLGRVVRDETDGSLVAELLLDRRLEVGDAALVRYAVHDRSGSRMNQYFRIHEWSSTHHALEVRFPSGTLPVRITEFHRARADVAEEVARDLRLTHDHRAQVLVPSSVPGVVGVRWEWD